MAGRSAVIFLLDDPFRDGGDEPLMLQRIRGVPALTWLAWGLYGRQVERFFLVCRPAMEQAARACFPAGAAPQMKTPQTSCTSSSPRPRTKSAISWWSQGPWSIAPPPRRTATGPPEPVWSGARR